MNKKIILGLAGELAAGKGTAAKYLEKKYKASSHRFSTMLRDILDRLYLEQNRENMQILSTILRQNFGEDTLAKVISRDVSRDDNPVIAIDGVRRLADIKYLRELPEFKLVYIETSAENRFKRIKKRGENTDDKNKTFEEFIKDHKGEAELQIRGLKNHADYVVDNNGGVDELYEQIDKIINDKTK
jgi:dephospho-CoA kinase